jgi:hypothetical protein
VLELAMPGLSAVRPTLTLALVMTLIAGAPAVAARHVQGAAASATHPHQKGCRKPRRGACHWIEISSYSFGVGRGISAPTQGASDREGRTSIGEITPHKPKRKGH